MPNGKLLEQMRNMADQEKLSAPQALPLLMAATADIYDTLTGMAEWKKGLEERVQAIESQDKREVAKWGALGVAAGAVVSGLAMIIVAAM
jgi:hypothetical protein